MSAREPIENAVVHAPHAPLPDYYGREENRPDWVQQVFDDTAPDYDRIERLIGFGSGSRYRREALLRAGLEPGMQVLDVGVGTGLVASQAARIVGDPTRVTGLDPSQGMLKSARVPAGVKLVEGRAENLPFAADSFDFLSMGYALRHIADLSVAFREFFRVLKPAGRLCVLEITRPENRFHAALLKGYMRTFVPLMAKWMARQAGTPVLWSYYWDTIETCAPPTRVLHTLEVAGFPDARRHVELNIFSEYRGHKPVR